MNMTTRLDDIPLKTMKTPNDNYSDDSDDPMVKDILNEFQQELEINSRQSPQQSYQQPPPPPQQPQQPTPSQSNYKINYPENNPKKTKQPFSYYNEDLLKKTAIIIIIVFIIFSPIFFPMMMEKLPAFIIPFIEPYEFYLKLLILAIIVYLLSIHNYL